MNIETLIKRLKTKKSEHGPVVERTMRKAYETEIGVERVYNTCLHPYTRD
jgi:hypothetical protein